MRLASVRRSLFSNEQERTKFLKHLVTGTLKVLRTKHGLSEHENYHEFCRLLGRLKTNYQLSELVILSNVFKSSSCLKLLSVETVSTLCHRDHQAQAVVLGRIAPPAKQWDQTHCMSPELLLQQSHA